MVGVCVGGGGGTKGSGTVPLLREWQENTNSSLMQKLNDPHLLTASTAQQRLSIVSSGQTIQATANLLGSNHTPKD